MPGDGKILNTALNTLNVKFKYCDLFENDLLHLFIIVMIFSFINKDIV